MMNAPTSSSPFVVMKR